MAFHGVALLSLGLVLLFCCVIEVGGLTIANRKVSSESWLYLERFGSVPREAFPEYMGGDGATFTDWTVYHNYDTSTIHDISDNLQQKHVNNSQVAGGLWVLGYPISYAEKFDDKVFNKGGSHSSWADSYGMSCSERIAFANYRYEINSTNSVPFDSEVDMGRNDEYPSRDEVKDYKFKWEVSIEITEENMGRFEPKLIYWVISNCGVSDEDALTVDPGNTNDIGGSCNVGPNSPYCQGQLDMYYKATFSHKFVREEDAGKRAGGRFAGKISGVSFQTIGVGVLTMIMGILHLVLVVPFAAFTGLALWVKRRLHMTVWMLFACIAFQFLGFFLMSMYCLLTGVNDMVPSRNLYLTAVFCFQVADVGLVGLFLCLAGGYTITRRKLKMQGRVRLVFFLAGYMTCKFAALIWYSFVAGEGKLYLLESPPGVMSLILVCFAFARFWRATHVTVVKWREHRHFYNHLRLLGGGYMLHGPIGNFIAAQIGEMFKIKFMWIWNQVFIVFTTLCLLLLYHPRVFPASFPFHAQIEDMKMYKLKKLEESTVVNNNNAAGSGDNHVVSFTGGSSSLTQSRPSASSSKVANSFTGGTSQTTAEVDSKGRVFPPSYFDRKQINHIKGLTGQVDAMIASLNNYSHSLNEILEHVNCEETPETISNIAEATKPGSAKNDLSKFEQYRLQGKNMQGMGVDGRTIANDYMSRNNARTDFRGNFVDEEAGNAGAGGAGGAGGGGVWKVAASSPKKGYSMEGIPQAMRSPTASVGGYGHVSSQNEDDMDDSGSEKDDAYSAGYPKKTQLVSRVQQEALDANKRWKEHELGSREMSKNNNNNSSSGQGYDDDEIDHTGEHISSSAFSNNARSDSDLPTAAATTEMQKTDPPPKKARPKPADGVSASESRDMPRSRDPSKSPPRGRSSVADAPSSSSSSSSSRKKAPAPSAASPYGTKLPTLDRNSVNAKKLSAKERYWKERQEEMEAESAAAANSFSVDSGDGKEGSGEGAS